MNVMTDKKIFLWVKKLQQRWKLEHINDVWYVLLAFALTGFSVMGLRELIFGYFELEKTFFFSLIYYILIFPIYNLILLIWGGILGKFQFFWSFEKRIFGRIFRKFKGIRL
jgi:hypothetical protein